MFIFEKIKLEEKNLTNKCRCCFDVNITQTNVNQIKYKFIEQLF